MSLEFDHIPSNQYLSLAGPRYYECDFPQVGNDLQESHLQGRPISYTRYFLAYLPEKVYVFLKRAFYALTHCFKWENNASLLWHLNRHITHCTSLNEPEYREITQIFKKIVEHTGDSANTRSFREKLAQKRPHLLQQPNNDVTINIEPSIITPEAKNEQGVASERQEQQEKPLPQQKESAEEDQEFNTFIIGEDSKHPTCSPSKHSPENEGEPNQETASDHQEGFLRQSQPEPKNETPDPKQQEGTSSPALLPQPSEPIKLAIQQPEQKKEDEDEPFENQEGSHPGLDSQTNPDTLPEKQKEPVKIQENEPIDLQAQQQEQILLEIHIFSKTYQDILKQKDATTIKDQKLLFSYLQDYCLLRKKIGSHALNSSEPWLKVKAHFISFMDSTSDKMVAEANEKNLAFLSYLNRQGIQNPQEADLEKWLQTEEQSHRCFELLVKMHSVLEKNDYPEIDTNLISQKYKRALFNLANFKPIPLEFETPYQEFLTDCRQWHAEFQEIFGLDPLQPSFDETTRYVSCTPKQLEWALKKWQTHKYACLFKLRFNTADLNMNQKLRLSRALQVILCGPACLEKKLPLTEFCFTLPPSSSPLQPVDARADFADVDSSFVATQFKKIKSGSNVTNKDRFQEVYSQFYADWNRAGITLQVGNQKLRSKTSSDCMTSLVSFVKKFYTRYLNQVDAQEGNRLVQTYKDSPIVKMAREAYADSLQKDEFERSFFPTALFAAIDQTHEQYLNKICEDLPFSDEQSKGWAQKFNCSQEDLNALLRVVLFNMMCTLNQSVAAPLTAHLSEKTVSYIDPEEKDPLTLESRLVGDIQKGGMDAYTSAHQLFQDQDTRVYRFAPHFNDCEFSLVYQLKYAQGTHQGNLYGVTTSTVKIENAHHHSKIEYLPCKGLYLNHLANASVYRHFAAPQLPHELTSECDNILAKLKELKEPEKQGYVSTFLSFVWEREDAQESQKPVKEVSGYLTNLRSLFQSMRAACQAPEASNYTIRLFQAYKFKHNPLKEIKDKLERLEILERKEIKPLYEDLEKIFNSWEEQFELFELEEGELDENAVLFECLLDENAEEISQALEEGDQEKVDQLLQNVVQTYKDLQQQDSASIENEMQKTQWKIVKYEKMIKSLQEKAASWTKKFAVPEKLFKEEQSDWTPFEKAFSKLLRDLMSVQLPQDKSRFTKSYLDGVRQAYSDTFIDNVRQVLALIDEAKEPIPNNLEKFVYKLCEHRIAGIVLTAEMSLLVSTFDQVGKSELDKNVDRSEEAKEPTNLVERLHRLNKRFQAVPQDYKASKIDINANSLRGHFNSGFDPSKQGNLPQHLYSIEYSSKTALTNVKKTRKMLAFGTPTIEFLSSGVVITPEFKAFLKSYQMQKKRHLYVSHQNAIPVSAKGWKNYLAGIFGKKVVETVVGGDETSRTKAIMELQDGEFRGTFFAVTLSRNSDFYNQKIGGSKAPDLLHDYKLFKDALINEYFVKKTEESGNYISEDVKKQFKEKTGQSLEEWSKGVCDAIYKHLFEVKDKKQEMENQQSLEVKERKLFNKVFQSLLILKLTDVLDVESFNTSCKDCIDRGAESFSTIFGILMTLNNLEKDEKTLNFYETIVVSRAIMVRKRQMLEERFDSLCEVMEFTLGKKQGFQSLFNEMFNINLSAIPVSA